MRTDERFDGIANTGYHGIASHMTVELVVPSEVNYENLALQSETGEEGELGDCDSNESLTFPSGVAKGGDREDNSSNESLTLPRMLVVMRGVGRRGGWEDFLAIVEVAFNLFTYHSKYT